MLEEGRLPLNAAEHDAVEQLIGEHGPVSISRSEPGETGVLIVQAAGRTWRVQENGDTEEEAV